MRNDVLRHCIVGIAVKISFSIGAFRISGFLTPTRSYAVFGWIVYFGEKRL